jgi:type II secretory pathway component GspD/PulD (secretin)
MLWTKIKILTTCALAASALGIGGSRPRQTLGPQATANPLASRCEANVDKPDKAKKSKPKEKTYTLDLRDRPWRKVFEWYSDLTAKPFIADDYPKGKAHFKRAKGKRKYTLQEINDLLSEMLLAENYILIIRKTSLGLKPADEEIRDDEPGLLCPLDELKDRGKTEWVLVVLPLTTLKAKDLGPEIKKMMGPDGKVRVLEKANKLYLGDTVGNLRRIYQKVKDMQSKEAAKKRDLKKP